MQNESRPYPDKHTHRQTDTERQTENNHQNCHEVVTASLLPTVKDGRTDRSTLSIPFSICNIVCPGRQTLSLHPILYVQFQALSQLRQFGFEEAKIKAALVANGNDTEKALDQLMVT